MFVILKELCVFILLRIYKRIKTHNIWMVIHKYIDIYTYKNMLHICYIYIYIYIYVTYKHIPTAWYYIVWFTTEKECSD